MAEAYRGFDGRCYGSAELLDNAYYGTVPMNVQTTADGRTHNTFYWQDAGVWKQYVRIYNGTTVEQDIVRPTFSFWGLTPSCDPSAAYLDGMTIGWGIATAMVLAYAVVMMRKAMR